MKYLLAILVPLSLLPLSAVAQSEPKAPPAVDRNAPDYMRCEMQTEIGSRARKTRICHTNAEWKKLKAVSTIQARELGDPGRRNAPPGQ